MGYATVEITQQRRVGKPKRRELKSRNFVNIATRIQFIEKQSKIYIDSDSSVLEV